jgi:hypothetical protein
MSDFYELIQALRVSPVGKVSVICTTPTLNQYAFANYNIIISDAQI